MTTMPSTDEAAEARAIQLIVNGKEVAGRVEPRRLLSDFLREDLGLTGTHVGCEQGACGACTVLFDGRAVRSCLAFAVQADGARITTIEGISGPDGRLHPVQQALHETHGLQCGFCTPGVVVTACALLEDDPSPSRQAIREGLSGNLCRCTGYQSIVEAIERAADAGRPARLGEEEDR
jgi:carbon-monoxide dehydrogenase small subunit